jgi:hypothetical protein
MLRRFDPRIAAKTFFMKGPPMPSTGKEKKIRLFTS